MVYIDKIKRSRESRRKYKWHSFANITVYYHIVILYSTRHDNDIALSYSQIMLGHSIYIWLLKILSFLDICKSVTFTGAHVPTVGSLKPMSDGRFYRPIKLRNFIAKIRTKFYCKNYRPILSLVCHTKIGLFFVSWQNWPVKLRDKIVRLTLALHYNLPDETSYSRWTCDVFLFSALFGTFVRSHVNSWTADMYTCQHWLWTENRSA